jgi:hypothetical protein
MNPTTLLAQAADTTYLRLKLKHPAADAYRARTFASLETPSRRLTARR